MKIVELTSTQFDDYASKSKLTNYYQTSKYAILMSNHGYAYDLIGYIDETNGDKICAASVILNKKIKGSVRYGYAPKGFLIDYYDRALLESFLRALKDYYKRKGYTFIKFNPEIMIGKIDQNNKYSAEYNTNVSIIDTLKSLGLKRRQEQVEFELMEPKYQGFVNLKEFNFKKINRNYRKKIRHSISEGMKLVIGDVKQMDVFYEMIKHKTEHDIIYYRDLYNVYNKDNSIDLLFVKINFQSYLEYVKKGYEKEQIENEKWNEIIAQNPKKSNITAKMNSDNKLQGFNSKIIDATNCLKEKSEAIIAGALVIKHHNIITVIDAGYDLKFKHLNPNHFLYYAIMERYKPYFSFCNLGGISSFDSNAKYAGLNSFKLKWKPLLFEYIGEFDFAISEYSFKKFIQTNFAETEFAHIPYNKIKK